MTKYYNLILIDWDYDDIKNIESLLFSAPNKFEFKDINILKECMEAIGFTKCKIVNYSYTSRKSVKGKYRNRYEEYYKISNLLEFDNEIRRNVVKWLKEKHNVILLKTEEI